MADSPIPTALRGVIRSIWTLELLLLMKRQPDRIWTGEALVQELRGSSSLVEQNLKVLVMAGLVSQREQGFSYGPPLQLMAEASDQLERAYRERPVAVINAIASGVESLHSFADAFKFKRDDK